MPQSHEIDEDDVLVVRDLNVAFSQQRQRVSAVRNLSFSLRRGETLAIVGESGSGKSVTALALMRLLDGAVSEVSSEALLLRRRNRQVIDINAQTAGQMRQVRGADVAMIFQEPMTSLNPVFTIGEQIAESIRLHQGLRHDEALREAKKMLERVRIPEAEAMLSRYPHQLSGGMRQRVMIAMALSCRPAVLIADEPTTALDVTIQAQILQLIAALQKEMAMGVMFITHDMGVVAEIADRVLVMYRGEAVESGRVEDIFRAPQHPSTRALLAAVPKLGSMRGSDLPRRFPLLNDGVTQQPEQNTVVAGKPILQVRDLVARFPIRGGWWKRKAVASSLTASVLMRCPAASYRRCAAIFSLFFRILTLRSTRGRRSVIPLWSRCACMGCWKGMRLANASPGCCSAWGWRRNTRGVIRMSFPAVSGSVSVSPARWRSIRKW